MASKLPAVLGAMPLNVESRETQFTLRIEGGDAYDITLTSPLEYDANDQVIWTAPQIEQIQKALGPRLAPEILPSLFGLKNDGPCAPTDLERSDVKPNWGDGPAPFPRNPIPTPEALDPPCGTCSSGRICYIGTEKRCCNSKTGVFCQICKVCG